MEIYYEYWWNNSVSMFSMPTEVTLVRVSVELWDRTILRIFQNYYQGHSIFQKLVLMPVQTEPDSLSILSGANQKNASKRHLLFFSRGLNLCLSNYRFMCSSRSIHNSYPITVTHTCKCILPKWIIDFCLF